MTAADRIETVLAVCADPREIAKARLMAHHGAREALHALTLDLTKNFQARPTLRISELLKAVAVQLDALAEFQTEVEIGSVTMKRDV